MFKDKNFFLMLKQGIKGVFQFKAQFIIIIILAFVATFILSISVSTQRNLKSSFDQIVKPVQRFAYQGNIQVDSDADSNKSPFLLENEVSNATPNELNITAGGNSLSDDSSYNFVFYNGTRKNDKGQTVPWYLDANGDPVNNFLTKGTEEYIKNAGAGDAFNGYVINGYYLSYLFNELDEISALNHDKKAYASLTTQTKYSPVGIYTFNNPGWYKPFINKMPKAGTPIRSSDVDAMFSWDNTNDLKDRDVMDNVVSAVSQLSGFLSNSLSKIKSLDNDKVSATNAEAIPFLFGVNANGTNASKPNWVVSGAGDQGSRPYSLNITIDADATEPGKDDVLANYESSDPNNASLDVAIYNSGLRGISSPFVDGSTKQPAKGNKAEFSANSIFAWDNNGWLSVNPEGGQSLYDNLDMDGDWYSKTFDNGDMDELAEGTKNDPLPLETLFRVHNVLSAEATGFTYKLRRESTYFDANNQLKFRAIALNDNEKYNFTILRGRYPGAGEVAISEQFAKKNKIKVGDPIKSGDGHYIVSAIATDALSYLPSQDLANPIPNPKVSSFVYASQATIDKIWGGTATSDGSDDAVTKNVSFFLTNNKDSKAIGTQDAREGAFLALFGNDKGSIKENFLSINDYINNGTVSYGYGASISLNSFDKSPYRYSFTIQPMVFAAYDAVTYIASAIIALIAVISVIVCVKKTIDLNSKQIGILKALGEQPKNISVNYLSYSLILGCLVVPIAWIIGNVLQIPFSNMFITYFSVQPDTILWDWISFVIAFGVLGVLSAGVSYFSAWFLTNKPVLSVLTSSVKWGRLRFIDWLKNSVFKKSGFSTRFSLTLTSSGSRQIILMTVVMFIASLLMSLSLAIPSVASRISSSYYKSVKYANKYSETPMIGNAPLSKNAISYWNGHDYLDSQYEMGNNGRGLQLDDSAARYGFYKDPEAYIESASGSSAFGQYLYDANAKTVDAKGNPINQPHYISDFNNYLISHEKQIMDIVGSLMGNNYFTHLGVTFSVGMVDKIYGVLLHSMSDITDMADPTIAYSDAKKLSEARQLSGWLTQSVPKIIATIVNSNAGGSSGGGQDDKGAGTETWKQKVMDAIYKVVPSYVKAYIQRSDSRLDQYGISFNNEIYIPGQETLTTDVDNSNSIIQGKAQQMTLTGLDKNQKSIVVDQNRDKLFLDDATKQALQNRINLPMNQDGTVDTQVLNEDVKDKDGDILYDGKTHTFNIPVMPNKQAASAFKLDTGKSYDGWDNSVQMLQMLTSDGITFNIPKTAWIYDDTDFVNYLKNKKNKDDPTQEIAKVDAGQVPYEGDTTYNPSTPNNNWRYETVKPESDANADNDPDATPDSTHYYLEPSSLDNNKLTYTLQFDDQGKMRDKATLFKAFKYGAKADGQPTGSYVRPAYQYKNFRLMVPKSWVDEHSLLWPTNYTKNNDETTQWYKDNVPADEIPQSVKDGYKKLVASRSDLSSKKDGIDGDWIVINPYDLNYFAHDFEKNQKMALTNLVDGPAYWYYGAFWGNSQIKVGNTDVVDMFGDTGANINGRSSINLHSVGEIDSYNDKLIVTDSDLANGLLNYPTSRYYAYNYQTFDLNNPNNVPAGKPDKGDKNSVSQFDRYEFADVNNPDFINSDWDKNPKLKQKDLWHLSWQPYVDAIGGNKNITAYAPHNFYNGKLSNIDEPLEYTTQISFSKNIRVGQSAIALGDNMYGGTPSMITNSQLLSTTKQLINQLTVLVIAIGAMLMAAIIITAALLTMLTGDIYIEQYKRFMVLLRALGYSKVQVFTYTFAPVTILSLVAWVGGTILAWGLVYIATNVMWAAGMAIPVGITWWPIVISFFVMFLSYAGSLYVSSGKARKANPSEILTATAE